MVGSAAWSPSLAPGRPTLRRPVRIGDWPVMKAARPAVQLCWPYAVGEDRALLGDAVDVGRAVAHHALVVGADVPVADVVAQDDQDVRLLGGRLGGGLGAGGGGDQEGHRDRCERRDLQDPAAVRRHVALSPFVGCFLRSNQGAGCGAESAPQSDVRVDGVMASMSAVPRNGFARKAATPWRAASSRRPGLSWAVIRISGGRQPRARIASSKFEAARRRQLPVADDAGGRRGGAVGQQVLGGRVHLRLDPGRAEQALDRLPHARVVLHHQYSSACHRHRGSRLSDRREVGRRSRRPSGYLGASSHRAAGGAIGRRGASAVARRGSRRAGRPSRAAGSGRGAVAQALGETAELRRGADAQLGEHLGAVGLDRAFGDPQLAGDLLVEPAGDDELEDLALARGERREAGCAAGAPPRARRAARRRAPRARRSASKSVSRSTGLVRKSTAPVFIARTLEETSAWPVRKITGSVMLALAQGRLQVETGRARHAHVEQHAARAVRRRAHQEVAGRAVAARVEAGGGEQAQQRGAQRFVVVDDMDERSGLIGSPSVRARTPSTAGR